MPLWALALVLYSLGGLILSRNSVRRLTDCRYMAEILLLWRNMKINQPTNMVLENTVSQQLDRLHVSKLECVPHRTASSDLYTLALKTRNKNIVQFRRLLCTLFQINFV